jgi:hypothetical protein
MLPECTSLAANTVCALSPGAWAAPSLQGRGRVCGCGASRAGTRLGLLSRLQASAEALSTAGTLTASLVRSLRASPAPHKPTVAASLAGCGENQAEPESEVRLSDSSHFDTLDVGRSDSTYQLAPELPDSIELPDEGFVQNLVYQDSDGRFEVWYTNNTCGKVVFTSSVNPSIISPEGIPADASMVEAVFARAGLPAPQDIVAVEAQSNAQCEAERIAYEATLTGDRLREVEEARNRLRLTEVERGEGAQYQTALTTTDQCIMSCTSSSTTYCETNKSNDVPGNCSPTQIQRGPTWPAYSFSRATVVVCHDFEQACNDKSDVSVISKSYSWSSWVTRCVGTAQKHGNISTCTCSIRTRADAMGLPAETLILYLRRRLAKPEASRDGPELVRVRSMAPAFAAAASSRSLAGVITGRPGTRFARKAPGPGFARPSLPRPGLRPVPGSRAGVGRRSFVVGSPPGATLPLREEQRLTQRRGPSRPRSFERSWLARAAQTNRWAAPGIRWSLLAR